MHAPALFVALSALLATTVTAAPAPLDNPIEYPELVSDDFYDSLSLTARDFGTGGELQGDLPDNVAKVWAFTQGQCNFDDGPSFMWTVPPNTDRCIPVKNVGSIFVWKKNSEGKGTCTVTLHSGDDCRGIQWTPFDKQCGRVNYASILVVCPPNN